MTARTFGWRILILLGAVCCVGVFANLVVPSSEPFRPQYHFSPPNSWMNDPNGLVYDNGEYHLFYQFNPNDTKWGPMHWGHAVSPDLLHWQHLPVALEPDQLGTIFSGSAVIDTNNTAGFGAGAMVAIFTHDQTGRQMQSLAYSSDHGRTWTKYAGNPVLEPPANIRNFRDPKVFWYDQGDRNSHWVMLLAVGNAILFYGSPDLKTWTASGGIGFGYGATCGVWETPDLFELPIAGSNNKRWVLTTGVNNCAPAGGTGTQYFVGQFNGKTFTSDNPKNTILWADYGADFYAAQSWNNTPDQRRIWIAWLNNWQYAQSIPTSSWRGALTIPRELGLAKTKQGLRLTQRPISELEQLKTKHWEFKTLKLSGQQTLKEVTGETLEIKAIFKLGSTKIPARVGIRVRVGQNEQTTIGFNTKASKLFVDRSHSGQVNFASSFASAHTVTLEPVNHEIRLHLLVDRSSVEVFSEDGLISMTESIFPNASSLGVQLFAEGGQVIVSTLEIDQLKPSMNLK
jgi:fructan beta-fructosidase